jgi:hypothetical protein
MATVNKDFRLKNGLIVEGTNATVNGNQVLTENASDQYIIDLIGGETLVTSVNSTQLEVVDGELSVKDNVFDASGAASTAQQNAEDYTDTALESYTPTSSLETTLDGYGYLKSDDLPTMYSDSDVDAHLSGGDGITYSTGTISADVAGGLEITGGQIVVDRDTVDTWYDANGAAGDVASDLSTHEGLTSGVHGVTGNVVGTTDTQDLSNKRIIDTLYFSDGVTISEEGEIAVRAVSHDFDVQANQGDLHLKTVAENSDVQITSTYGDILLNADGAAYYGSASAENEIATHGYVDNAISGLTWKQSVNLLSSTNVDISGSLVGVVIDGHAAFDTADNGYRILLTGQSTASENGIYELLADGAALNASRPADANSFDELVGAAVYVMEGTTYGSTSWVQGNHYLSSFTGQSWTQFSGQGSVTAGEGITVDGLEVSIDRTTVDDWYEASGAVSTHSDLTTGVHGVTGDVVGTSDQQTLTNKTIDASSNTLSNIANSSLTNSSITVNGNTTSLGDSVTLYTDDVDENAGGTNQYFTQTRARDSFSAGNAISYNSGTGEIAVDASQLDSDDIAEGETNLYYTDSRAKAEAAALLTNATKTNITITADGSNNLTITAENGVADSTTDDLVEGEDNLYFTDARAVASMNQAFITPQTVWINNSRQEEAVQVNVSNPSTVTVHTGNPYLSTKYLVRVEAYVNSVFTSQVTELLMTSDAQANVAITEFGSLCTGENDLATFSSTSIDGTPALTATTSVSNAKVIAVATMFGWAS